MNTDKRMKRWCHSVLLGALAMCCSSLMAETVVLKDGKTLEGDIVRTVGERVTVRTHDGYSTYHVGELDQKWVDSHYDRIFTEIEYKKMEKRNEAVSLLKGLAGEESLANSRSFLQENQGFMIPFATAAVLVGVTLCYMGWRLFQLGVVLGGILSGALLGLSLGGAVGGGVISMIPDGVRKEPVIVLVLVLLVFSVAGGALLGKSLAMSNARWKRLRGGGSGWMGSVNSLRRFAMFDLSVIWGHALFGAMLIISGAYCVAAVFAPVADGYLQILMLGCTLLGLAFCISGVIHQIGVVQRSSTQAPGLGVL